MMEKIKKYGIFILIILIILMFLSNMFLLNKVNNQSEKFDKYENTISALNSTIEHTVSDGIDKWSKKSPEILLNDLINSEYFKTLSADQQKYYKDLQKIKGLISSTQVELEKHGQMLGSLQAGTIEKDSTGKEFIKFALNDTLKFNEKDTTKKFQWNASVIMSNPVLFNTDYTYKPKIKTDFIRLEDKSIKVEYTIDDPELKVNNIQNFIIPIETDTRGPLKKWLNKNKVPLSITAGTAVFIGGTYVGYKLAK